MKGSVIILEQQSDCGFPVAVRCVMSDVSEASKEAFEGTGLGDHKLSKGFLSCVT